MLDARNATNGPVEHLVNYLIQADCYAGMEPQGAQGEASSLSFAVRAALQNLRGQTLDNATVTGVHTISHVHLPDQAFEPWRERYVLTVEVWAHA